MQSIALSNERLYVAAMQEVLDDLTESNMQCRHAGMSRIELPLPMLHDSDAAELINCAAICTMARSHRWQHRHITCADTKLPLMSLVPMTLRGCASLLSITPYSNTAVAPKDATSKCSWS